MEKTRKIKIKIKSYDPKVVDHTTRKVVEFAKTKGLEISGPVPLPTKKEIFTILRSVHINKKSREQFEIKTHKRLIVINNPNDMFVETFKKMEIPSGVDVEVIT